MFNKYFGFRNLFVTLAVLGFLGGLFAGCAANQVATDPPAGYIPAFAAPTGSATPLADSRTLHGHNLVAENANFALFLQESNLSVIIQDVQTGEYMRSTVDEPDPADNPQWQGLYQSGVTLDIMVGTNVHPTRADLVATPRDLSVLYTADGFSASVFFPDSQIGYTLIVTLTESGFTAEIPQSSIIEGDPNQTVGSFYIFPFLGHSRLGEDAGYMFIPDGQGALITLQDNEGRFNVPFVESVFGGNVGLEVDVPAESFWGFSFANSPEMVLMPVFGMVHTERQLGFLGVISSGAENAFVEAWPNGASTAFDWIGARFVYRHLFQQPTGMATGTIDSRTPRPNRVDAKITFIFVSGDSANYAGLAIAYREYLAATGAFSSAVMDNFNVGISFLGAEQRDWALFRLNVNMTTFNQAEDILLDLADEGVTGVFARFDGWSSGGSTFGLPTRGFNVAGNLGGAGDLRNLRNTAENLGGQLALLVNPLEFYTRAQPRESLSALRRVTGRTADFFVPGETIRLTTPSRTVQHAENTAAALSQNGFTADITAITHFLTSYSENSAYFDRHDSAVMYSRAIGFFDQPALTRPFANLWHHARLLTDIPAFGSGYLLTTYEVPFLAIATSGQIPIYLEYVNFQPNRRDFFLTLVETAARPTFLITAEDPAELRTTNRRDVFTSMYDMLREDIIQYYHELAELHRQIDGAYIVNHETDGNAVRVSYSNGLAVYINFGTTAASIDGTEIAALSYFVVGGV